MYPNLLMAKMLEPLSTAWAKVLDQGTVDSFRLDSDRKLGDFRVPLALVPVRVGHLQIWIGSAEEHHDHPGLSLHPLGHGQVFFKSVHNKLALPQAEQLRVHFSGKSAVLHLHEVEDSPPIDREIQ